MSILNMTPERLAQVGRFKLEELDEPGGRVTIFEPPVPGHDYALGADFALGVPDRDFDAGIVLDASVEPVRQVATLHGHWGERYDRVLYAAATTYNDAFLMGERQCGLPIMRALLDEYGYAWMWFQRDYAKRSKRRRDALGWPKTAKRAFDPLLRGLRLAVKERKAWLRDLELIDQMGRLQFAGPDSKEPEELLDEDMDLKLLGGGSPDLVYAAMYAWTAVQEMGKFERPAPRYQTGTLGDILGHEELENEDEKKLYEQRPMRRRRRRR